MRAPSPAALQPHAASLPHACPKCGGQTSVTSVMPLMSPPEIDEVTYVCRACGTETKVLFRDRPSALAANRRSP